MEQNLFPAQQHKGFVIRPAVSGDLDRLARLYRENHLASYRALLPDGYCDALTEEASRAKWTQFLACPGNRI